MMVRGREGTEKLNCNGWVEWCEEQRTMKIQERKACKWKRIEEKLKFSYVRGTHYFNKRNSRKKVKLCTLEIQ